MSLDDIDKKFIEASIQKSVKKSVDENMEGIAETVTKGLQEKTKNVSNPKQDLSEKIDDLQKQVKNNHDEILKELQNRELKGQNTLAQKVEMQKLISQKETTSIEDKEGKASQRGAKTGKILESIMRSNPLTGFLYDNRDFLRGIGEGAKKVLESSISLFKKNPDPNNPSSSSSSSKKDSGLLSAISSPLQGLAETMIQTKESEKSWQEKIDDLHQEYIINEKKERARRALDLSKGLKGLDKTMKSIGDLADMIGKKQKLILGGITIGVVALLGLAAWLKGRFGSNKTPNVKPQEFYDTAKKEFNKKREDRIEDLDQSIAKEQKTGEVQEVKKNPMGLKNEGWEGKVLSAAPTSGYKMQASAGQPYRAPFDLKVVNWSKNEKNKASIDMEVERIATVTKKNAIIMNLEDPQIVPGQTAKKGQIIGRVPALGEIFIKDITKEEFEAYKGMIDDFAGRSDEAKAKELEEAKTFMNTDQSNKVRNSWKALEKEVFKESEGVTFEDGKLTERDAKNFVSEQVKSKQGFAAEADPEAYKGASIGAAPETSAFHKVKDSVKRTFVKQPEWDRTKQLNQENKTDSKVQAQNEKLKERPLNEIPAEISAKKEPEQKPMFISAAPSSSGGGQPSDIFNLNQMNVAFNSTSDSNVNHG